MSKLLLLDGDMYERIGNYWIGTNGYALCKKDKLVHREVVKVVLGRELLSSEVVHHVNYNRLDNRRENLVVCPDDSYHALLHCRTDAIEAGYSPDIHKYCYAHKEYHPKEEFGRNKRTVDGLHGMCKASCSSHKKSHGYNIDKFDWKAKLSQQYRRAFRKGGVICPLQEGRCP